MFFVGWERRVPAKTGSCRVLFGGRVVRLFLSFGKNVASDYVNMKDHANVTLVPDRVYLGCSPRHSEELRLTGIPRSK